MTLTFQRQFTLAFGLLFGLLAALVGLGAVSAARLHASLDAVERARETLVLSQRVRSALFEAELAAGAGDAARGVASLARAWTDAAALRAIDTTHPEHGALHAQLQDHLQARRLGPARAVLQALVDDEAGLLLDGRRRGVRSMELALITGSVLALFAAALLAASAVLLQRELRRREHARSEEERLRTVLEQRVSERTDELQRALTSLAQSESRLRRLLSLLPESVLVHDGDRIAFANDAACRLFGMDAQALAARPVASLFHPDSRALVGERVQALRAGTDLLPPAQEAIVTADGSTRHVETTSARIDAGDGPAIVSVMRDVSELHRARRELALSRDELRRLVANQEQVREGERVRIARELHDDLQQTLAAIKLDLVSAAALARQGSPQVAPLLEELDELVGNAIVSTRRIVNDLRPQLLDELGLVAALRSLAAQFEQRNAITVRVVVVGLDEDEAVPPGASICLYRVAQEALQNVAKHAQATHVELRLAYTAAGRLRLRVRDDGRGLDVGRAADEHSFGLIGMRERVRALHGELHIAGRPGTGTTVEASLPWAREAAEETPAP
ncbi:MAG TPA: PAS domain S-box protein [Burkholderiaceae bacterium]|nr:PAS domain S-box protein [Burkholderiaceae bacterium]